MKQELINFIPYPRYLDQHINDGHMTDNESKLYLRLRAKCNPYGIASVYTDICALYLYRSKKKQALDAATKILRSLRKKRYIYYKDRQGFRGEFSVHFAEIATPKGTVTNLEHFFNDVPVQSGNALNMAPASEAHTELGHEIPKSKVVKRDLDSWRNSFGKNRGIRSHNTDTNTDTNTIDTLSRNMGNRYNTNHFVPNSYEQECVLAVAREVGEEKMHSLLFILEKSSHDFISNTFKEIKKTESFRKAENKPAYLNTVLRNRLKEKGIELEENTDIFTKPY